MGVKRNAPDDGIEEQEAVKEPRLQIQTLEILPSDILCVIFSYLSFCDLAGIFSVCKSWNKIAKVDWLFKEPCLRRFPAAKKIKYIKNFDSWKELTKYLHIGDMFQFSSCAYCGSFAAKKNSIERVFTCDICNKQLWNFQQFSPNKVDVVLLQSKGFHIREGESKLYLEIDVRIAVRRFRKKVLKTKLFEQRITGVSVYTFDKWLEEFTTNTNNIDTLLKEYVQ